MRLAVMGALAASSSSIAAPAPNITQFDILAVTSAIYNPILPSPLTPSSALSMDWDIVDTPAQIKTSGRIHGGGWLAFVIRTYGYRYGIPTGSYTSAPVVYFGTVNIVDPVTRVVTGFYDEYYCSPCNPGGTFSSTTQSINMGGSKFAYMSVR
jgi:hypothetical protein